MESNTLLSKLSGDRDNYIMGFSYLKDLSHTLIHDVKRTVSLMYVISVILYANAAFEYISYFVPRHGLANCTSVNKMQMCV